MASLSKANHTATMVAYLSGMRTYLVRNQRGDVTVWHGGKKKQFSTNQGAAMYLDRLYKAYKAM